MARVQMYSMEWCPYCAKAKALLGAKNIEYDEVDVTDDEPAALEMWSSARASAACRSSSSMTSGSAATTASPT